MADNIAELEQKIKLLEEENSAMKTSLAQEQLKNQAHNSSILGKLADGDSITEILAKGVLSDTKPKWYEKIFPWLNKNSQALMAFVATITVGVFGLLISSNQQLQKDSELQISRVKTLGELVKNLASTNPNERKYATFAAISLGVGDFEKYVMSSLDSPDDIGTFEILLDRLKGKEGEYEVRKKLSFLYSKKAEELKDKDTKETARLAQLAIDILPEDKAHNAVARYRLAKILQEKGDFNSAINMFKQALTDFYNKENINTRADLNISVYERTGQCFDALNNRNEAFANFTEAKKILSDYQNKSPDDGNRIRLERLDGCLKSKEDCKIDG